jgi:hypothetical protein
MIYITRFSGGVQMSRAPGGPQGTTVTITAQASAEQQ